VPNCLVRRARVGGAGLRERFVLSAKVAEWSASQEGRRFLTASSDASYEASVVFGTDPAEARAAADRTAAFYTGAPERGSGVDQHG
jgi:hypothetical protein